MPKGDRLRLKADPEDGTTPIANLLLEAVAMAKISGLQKGAILHLWRKTYGWVGEDGKRIKESKITLQDWMKALDSSKSRTSEALAELETKGIMKRNTKDLWGGYYYSINTDVTKWNSNSVNLSKLAEQVGIPNFGTVAQNGTVTNNNNSSIIDNSTDKRNGTVAQNGTEQLPKTELPTLYKEILNKDKEIYDENKPTSNNKEITYEKTDDNGNTIIEKGNNRKPTKAQLDRTLIINFLKDKRGYPSPDGEKEKYSITRMLKLHSAESIMETWSKMKTDKFWSERELFMYNVEKQIGAILKGQIIKPEVSKSKVYKYVN